MKIEKNKLTSIQKKLFSVQDIDYKEFHSKLIPTINPETIIGVRTPMLRSLAKELFHSEDDTTVSNFTINLPHTYYEENNLHAFLIAQIKDFPECISELNRFLPCVDNWATCDAIRPVCFKSHTTELRSEIRRWLDSTHAYTIRFAIEMLMVHYLDHDFSSEYLDWVAEVQSDEYYINMMIAWYFATALAKQYDLAIIYIEEKRLSKWVHNKTIRKAIESYRITNEQKDYLRSLKW